jgi:hypothetical protein
MITTKRERTAMAEKNSSVLIYTKGSRIFCAGCGEHVTTLRHDMYYGQIIFPDHFEEHEGQGPWRNGEPLVCRKCQTLFIPEDVYAYDVLPESETIRVHREDYASQVARAEFQQGRAGRQAACIAMVMDQFFNKQVTEGLTPFESQVYLVLRGHLNSEIQMFNAERTKISGRTQ